MHTIKQIALVAILAVANISAHAEVAVVVSSKSNVSSLTQEQAADIFLGKSGNFPGGEKATPVDQSDSSSAREEFYTKATGKNASQVKALWSKLIFTGKGQAPKDVGDNAGVKKALADNPNAVGYIDKSAVDGSVKVLATVK